MTETELLTPAEAAAFAGCHERTLRKWALAGRLAPAVGVDGRPRYQRGDLAALRAGRRPPAVRGLPDPALPCPEAARERPQAARGPEAPAHDATLAELRARLDGARTAARIHAARRSDTERELARLRAELERSRESHEREAAWLRARVEASEASERELRLLLAQATRALPAAPERPALAGSARPRWWRLAWWRW